MSFRIITAIVTVALFLGAGEPDTGAGSENDPFERGVAYLNSGLYDRAIETFSIILEVYPEDYETYNNRGIAWSRKGEFELAVYDFTKALDLYPAYAPAYINRGVVWQKRNNPGRAILDYTQGLELAPGFGNTYAALAWILSTCPDPRYRDGRMALVLAQQAAALDSGALGLDVLAAVYAEMGQFYQAAALQRKHIQSLESTGELAQVERQAPVLAAYEDKRALVDAYPLENAQNDLEAAAVMQRLRRFTGLSDPAGKPAAPLKTPSVDDSAEPGDPDQAKSRPVQKEPDQAILEAVVDLRPPVKKKGVDSDFAGSRILGGKKDN